MSPRDQHRSAALALVELIVRAETEARALQAASKALRLMVGGWRFAAVPLDAASPITWASPGWDDPESPLDNPLFPDWAEDFLEDVLRAQQELADFANKCDERLMTALEAAAQLQEKNPTLAAQHVAAAFEQYRRCLRRPHPQQVVEHN